eukprot:608647-Pyramimonas_sp.AAC.1
MGALGRVRAQDSWPQCMGETEKQQLEKYYVCVPEKFYYLSGLIVITPDNAEEWCQQMSKGNRELELLESLGAPSISPGRVSQLAVGCPAASA